MTTVPPNPDPAGVGDAEEDAARAREAGPLDSSEGGSDGAAVGSDDVSADIAASGAAPQRNADDGP